MIFFFLRVSVILQCSSFRGGWIFIFRLLKSIFFVNCVSFFLNSYTVLTYYIYYCCIWAGESEWFVIFRLFKSILFFINWISLYFFLFLIKYYHIMFIIIVFSLGSFRPLGLLFFCACFSSFHIRSCLCSYHLRLFLCLISFLLFPCASVLGKHSCISSHCPIAILKE